MATLVMGATGNVGPHVVAALQRRSAPVRVLARDPERAATRLPAGIDIVRGDFTDEASVRAAADGVEAPFLLTPHAHGHGWLSVTAWTGCAEQAREQRTRRRRE